MVGVPRPHRRHKQLGGVAHLLASKYRPERTEDIRSTRYGAVFLRSIPLRNLLCQALSSQTRCQLNLGIACPIKSSPGPPWGHAHQLRVQRRLLRKRVRVRPKEHVKLLSGRYVYFIRQRRSWIAAGILPLNKDKNQLCINSWQR